VKYEEEVSWIEQVESESMDLSVFLSWRVIGPLTPNLKEEKTFVKPEILKKIVSWKVSNLDVAVLVSIFVIVCLIISHLYFRNYLVNWMKSSIKQLGHDRILLKELERDLSSVVQL